MTMSPEKRIENNFDKCWRLNEASGCWDWQRGKCKGYGVLKANGRHSKAYRFAYERAYGPIPDGAHVLHSCDNKGCVNPAHLRIGTHAENMRDKAERFVGWPTGAASHRAKLSTQQVKEMLLQHAAGETQMRLADAFNVKQSTVSMIVLGKTWAAL